MLSRLSPIIVTVALVALGPGGATALHAQQGANGEGAAAAGAGTIAAEQENFRAAPQGTILAELSQGTPLSLTEERGRWRQATLDGWIWRPSVRQDSADGHDLIVNAAAGENLRDGPGGELIGRVRSGTRLQTVEEQEQWVRVRRTGWIWAPSLEISAAQPETPEPVEPVGENATDAAQAEPPQPSASPQAPATGARQAADEQGQQGLSTAAPQGQQRFATAGPQGLTVLAAPAGDSVARVRPGGTFEVLDREGEWSRVRVEGWVRTSILTAPDSLQGGVLRDIPLVELQADLEGGRGRLVEWTLQFIALQHADRFRSEFAEGEAFILARGPGEEASFVYVAVPPDREAEVRKLTPLQRVRVLGRVRTARSRLTDAPIIDLLEITPLR